MAATQENVTKAGLGAEEWLKMWEGGFTHDHSHVPDEQGGGGDEHHSHDHHGHEHEDEPHSCNPTESDVDEKGNELKVDKYLKNNLKHLTDGKTDKTVLVSLCGNSPDMEWLSSKGYNVVGVELSEIAVKSAFEKSEFKSAKPIPFEVTADGNVKMYSATDGKKLKVYIANFFDDALNPEKIGTFDCIWDAHGIVSIPVPQQEPYAKKLLTFLKPGGKMLFSTVAYDITKLKTGPAPSPVPVSTLQGFFPQCKVQLLESIPLGAGELDGVDEWTNEVILIS